MGMLLGLLELVISVTIGILFGLTEVGKIVEVFYYQVLIFTYSQWTLFVFSMTLLTSFYLQPQYYNKHLFYLYIGIGPFCR